MAVLTYDFAYESKSHTNTRARALMSSPFYTRWIRSQVWKEKWSGRKREMLSSNSKMFRCAFEIELGCPSNRRMRTIQWPWIHWPWTTNANTHTLARNIFHSAPRATSYVYNSQRWREKQNSISFVYIHTVSRSRGKPSIIVINNELFFWQRQKCFKFMHVNNRLLNEYQVLEVCIAAKRISSYI